MVSVLRRLFETPTTHVALALGLALTAPSLLGCDKELTESSVPDGGVALAYTLAPGAVYSGHVTSRETLGAAGASINRRLDFDVTIGVSAVDEAGAAKVRAVVSNLSMEWALPPGAATFVNVDDFVANMTKRLNGVEIPFTVTKTGKVTDVPPLPPELNEQEALVANAVIDGLTRAFFVVPDDALQSGATWTDEDSRGRKGKLGRYSEWSTTNRFDGLYDYKPKEGGTVASTVARLTIETDKTEVTTTKEGGHETKLRSKTVALFNVDDGYLSKLEGTDTKYDGPDMSTVKFSASWKQTQGGGERQAPDAEGQTQAITDPCDPDYVGGEDCPAGGAETQAITDPCDPDYVGGEDCPADGAAEGGEEDGGEATDGDDQAAEGDEKAAAADE